MFWVAIVVVICLGLASGYTDQRFGRLSVFQAAILTAGLGPSALMALVLVGLATLHPRTIWEKNTFAELAALFATIIIVYSLPAVVLVALGGILGRVLRWFNKE